MLQRDVLVCGLLFWGSSTAAAPPRANNDGSTTIAAKGRRLTGKFLHITDFHPDPFYKTYSSTAEEAACHRHRGPAGIYGAETSACDSPFALINQTFQWINNNIKNDIDFVIWTGDSARHDNDDTLPRLPKQVVQQNEFMVSKFKEVFGPGEGNNGHGDEWVIPVVPTFGNNDIMPHNIFLAGPNRWTKKYLDVWRDFIPEAQRHQFQQGGWFSVEVIPGKLAVISLNTIYFFSSNSAVDGCANKHDPGYEHMEWLRIQLQIIRERGMKAILMGHVPPARVNSKESWDETCWQKYTLWERQFRDVIVGGLYGHMNIDHFMLQDFNEISKDADSGKMASGSSMNGWEEDGKIALYEDGEVTVASASDYLLDLREAWGQLPAPPPKSTKHPRTRAAELNGEEDEAEASVWSWLVSKIKKPLGHKSEKKKYLEMIGGKFAERYSVTLVAPSVVPNYYPTLRIVEYNITGLENTLFSGYSSSNNAFSMSSQQLVTDSEDLDDDEYYLEDVEAATRKKKKSKGPRKYKFKVPDGPSRSSPPGPAYSPQVFTWTRYTQYFANLTHINNDFIEGNDTVSKNEHTPSTIFGLNVTEDGQIGSSGWKEGKHGKHQGKQPRPEPHPNEFVFEIEYDTKENHKFSDLTVRRWVEYARKIGQNKAKAVGTEQTAEDLDSGNENEDDESFPEQQDSEGEDVVEDMGKGKKHKKKRKHHKASKEWYTFVKRAFVGTMNPHEIKQLFYSPAPVEASEQTPEIVEL